MAADDGVLKEHCNILRRKRMENRKIKGKTNCEQRGGGREKKEKERKRQHKRSRNRKRDMSERGKARWKVRGKRGKKGEMRFVNIKILSLEYFLLQFGKERDRESGKDFSLPLFSFIFFSLVSSKIIFRFLLIFVPEIFHPFFLSALPLL